MSGGNGNVICEMQVDESHTNRAGMLHGGMTAMLVDSVSTMALMTTDRGMPGVSVDMSIMLAYSYNCFSSNYGEINVNI